MGQPVTYTITNTWPYLRKTCGGYARTSVGLFVVCFLIDKILSPPRGLWRACQKPQCLDHASCLRQCHQMTAGHGSRATWVETDGSSVEMLAGLQQGTKSTHHSADTFHPSINWYTQSINSSNDKLYQLTESLRTLHQLTDMHHPPINWHAPSINQLKHSSNQSVNWHTPSSNWSTETLHQLINWNTPPIKWSTVTLHQSFG